MNGWPDLELLAVRWLSNLAEDVRVVTVLPARLEQSLPVVRVSRGPGSDDGVTDAPLLDVEVFAGARPAMWQLAEGVRQHMLGLAGREVSGWLVDTVSTASGPVWVDYENPAVSRAVSSFRVGLRRPR